MPLPYDSIVNNAISQFAKKETPSILDWNHVTAVSNFQAQLIQYEADGRNMSFEELLLEQHDSGRLSKHMESNADPRPSKHCDCHAIIAGKHPMSAPMRAVMAWVKMRIDFPLNGAWLPHNTAAKIHMPKHLRNAVPHSRIHRKGYYRWLGTLINTRTIKNDRQLANVLRQVRTQLENSSFPNDVMLRADQIK